MLIDLDPSIGQCDPVVRGMLDPDVAAAARRRIARFDEPEIRSLQGELNRIAGPVSGPPVHEDQLVGWPRLAIQRGDELPDGMSFVPHWHNDGHRDRRGCRHH
jgi:hypothetical protein